ncbi:D-alanyl-D-alanine carboxypeptidase [Leptolyngbya sp. FACHB-261]|uniref:D-alanyl-D-alanine carboxypeptidase n=1 Tax=Leptolyngbya sp. FACHB-261 TaxID=2692806 RepID=UPI001682D945|nr:D-alanyl-D-alanine carboxypeptidase [Leptolyngbya sp. FACHB-261]MBD2102753.1 D-alanyl-D-alanine carboxypeptidase [Leptolyngbya sp. FACHB-261]
MLELLGAGFLSLWLKSAGVDVPTLFNPLTLLASMDSSLQVSDAGANSAVERYLSSITSRGFSRQMQGVWIQAGPLVLSSQQGTTPLSAASLTKVATSLVALDTWGADHSFVTLLSARGRIQNGVLQGDLWVQGSGDPFFVWEEAIAVGNALKRAGINRVNGNLVVTGPFYMNFESDPLRAGALLKQAFNSSTWNREAQQQYQTLPPGTPRPDVVIAGTVRTAGVAASTSSDLPLIRHRSVPLWHLLKRMNIYSNNAMSEILAANLGGGPALARRAAQITQLPRREFQLSNGSGLGQENRLSPRAVAAMFMAIQQRAQPSGMSVSDLFPVAGYDLQGTVRYRRLPMATVIKTGTLSDVSALAGVLPTQRWGPVWFTFINRGTQLDGLRGLQDQLLQSLAVQWGAVPVAPEGFAPASWKDVQDRNELLLAPTSQTQSNIGPQAQNSLP